MNLISFCATRLVLVRSFLPQRLVTSAALCYFGLVKKRAAKIDTVGDHMRDIDRTLLRENLKLTFEQRAQKHLRALQMGEELRRAGKNLRQQTQQTDGR
jgi:phage terminase Nu1 subunit (DNA packaging protein)